MTAEGPAGFAVTRWGHVGGHRREGGSRRDRLHGAVSGSGPTRGTQHRVTAQGDATPTATQGGPPAGRAGGGCTQTRALPLPFFFRTEACKQKGECESQAAAPTGAWVPGPPDPARPDPPRMRPRRGRAGRLWPSGDLDTGADLPTGPAGNPIPAPPAACADSGLRPARGSRKGPHRARGPRPRGTGRCPSVRADPTGAPLCRWAACWPLEGGRALPQALRGASGPSPSFQKACGDSAVPSGATPGAGDSGVFWSCQPDMMQLRWVGEGPRGAAGLGDSAPAAALSRRTGPGRWPLDSSPGTWRPREALAGRWPGSGGRPARRGQGA